MLMMVLLFLLILVLLLLSKHWLADWWLVNLLKWNGTLHQRPCWELSLRDHQTQTDQLSWVCILYWVEVDHLLYCFPYISIGVGCDKWKLLIVFLSIGQLHNFLRHIFSL